MVKEKKGLAPEEIGKKTTTTTKKNPKKVEQAETETPNTEKVAIPDIEIVAAEEAVDMPVAKKGKTKKTKEAPIVPPPLKASKKVSKAMATAVTGKHITFKLRYSTHFGQNLFLTGNHELIGNNELSLALPLTYIDDEYWGATVEITGLAGVDKDITYNYILKNADETIVYDWGNDKSFNPSKLAHPYTLVIDSWNYAGYLENVFYSKAFKNILLKENYTEIKGSNAIKYTHTFKVKAPLLTPGQTLYIAGSNEILGNWGEGRPVIMLKEEGAVYFEAKIDLSHVEGFIEYKYGVYDIAEKKLVNFEEGNNRQLKITASIDSLTIINDGFAALPANTWKGAGVAIPVFSLRSKDSFGVGEFTDIIPLVDWCKKTGLKMIQLLPINDTTATHTWLDSYPYAAISAFALHPLYLNVSKMATNPKAVAIVARSEQEKERLNTLATVDYEAVMVAKWSIIKQIYSLQGVATLKTKEYQAFFGLNKHWLVPYACFCYLRDTNGSADFNNWPSYQLYKAQEISGLIDEYGEAYKDLALHYFIQYHLHLQLNAAADYAHQNGIVIKGDVPIGIARNGADAWQHPELYHGELQAGAPPDDFAVKGQNWGFPTYNWEKMKQDGFVWWKQRFKQMSHYFDAFRIDHILGFFRIWSIPLDAVEGILGHFVPAIPVHINELRDRGIVYATDRFTKPFINDSVLWEIFGYDNGYVKKTFLDSNENGSYKLKEEVSTQKKIEEHLAGWNNDSFTHKIKQGLFDLISNVILFETEEGDDQNFHFRFNISSTQSYNQLDQHTRSQLDELYLDYFFHRQNNYWMKEALEKLPALKRSTDMLVCGEDLGLVPECVPELMKQLGILSLEIQRMPKSNRAFFHPADAPYLSVAMPSTHDMSTIRGWWEEDKNLIQQFYNHELGQWGIAPFYCESWINKIILEQHLYSPAIWAVFQLQDMLGMDEGIRRENPHDERINVPANPKNYWRYRMHITLEDLLDSDSLNNQLSTMLMESGRS